MQIASRVVLLWDPDVDHLSGIISNKNGTFLGSCFIPEISALKLKGRRVLIEGNQVRGMPHTVRVERHQNELVVHVALLHGPDAKLPGGVLLHTEGWVDIGYGLKMYLVLGSGNISYHPKEIEEKKGLLQRLFPKKQPQPLLEEK